MLQMEREVMTNARYKIPYALMMFDIDLFKSVNDTYGHLVGDEVIRRTADVVALTLRRTDILARYGGEEFTIYLPHTTRPQAEMLAQRIRKAVEENRIPVQDDHEISVTISVGIIAVEEHPETEIRKLYDAGYLHDIGKIALLGSVLGKNPQSLTEAEREMVRQHPAVGYRILNLSANTLDLAESVYGHHERWNGSGYPKGLKGEEIPLHSRIIAVAEAYARIRNRHPKANSGGQALKILREGSGTQFDPKIVDALGRMLDESGGGI
jgi:diguanylate cyclase (GGDEF)-like protein